MLGGSPLGAFPLGGFPVVVHRVGWLPRYDPEYLEQRLKEQRGFGRKWFEEFVETTQAALAKAEQAKSPKQKAIIREAVEEVEEAASSGADIEGAMAALRAAINASRVSASIKHAELAIRFAKYPEWDDEEEEIEMLLLNG